MPIPGSTPTIVLIEDNPHDVRLLQIALDECGHPYVLKVLPDGEQALAYIEGQCSAPPCSRPCLVILDLHLPKYDGEAVLHAIREQASLSEVRVAVLSTQASPAEEARLAAWRVLLYRQKPLDFSGLVSLAHELMRLCYDESERAALMGA
jgi:two-component system, chemotaxis family, response regulator Rcp1